MSGLSLALALTLSSAPATAPAAAPLPDRVLQVGTIVSPPFVTHQGGRWSGTSIELWREIAGELGLRFELQERDLEGLFVGLEDGSLDIAVAGLTVTAEREHRVDFTHPFHTTGLAIALAHVRPDSWIDIFFAVSDLAFLRLLATFAGLQLAVGALMWLLERRNNPQFQGSTRAGIGSGLWWAVVTMATVGYGDKVPSTGAGRLLAMLWMLASLIILTTVTASLTTSLTVGRLEARVSGPEDLGKLRVGATRGTTSEAYLREMKLNFRSFADPEAGLAAIEARQLDALVDDAPTLTSLVEANHAGSIDILPRTFQRQDYALALPTASPLREPINQILARRVGDLQSD